MQSLKWDTSQFPTLDKAAEQFRDHIWAIVESWMKHLESGDGKHAWERIPDTQLIDNLPTLLRGVSMVIEDPRRIVDFDEGGVIHEAAAELGTNRQRRDYTPAELLQEQELLREIIWDFCRENFAGYNAFELEQRINRPLDKLTSTITEHYINAHTGELKQLARRDRQTGFLNYESFKESLNDELRRSRRYRHSFSLMLLDIDGFGAYNDAFGAHAGDALIKEVARVIAGSIRGVDIPARYGSDEFAIILPEVGRKQAMRAAERLRRAIKLETRHSAQVRGQLKTPITVSIGISSYPKDGEMVDEVISLADEALYEAKKAGKDMVAQVDYRKKR